ncbi:hypothetical protein Z948_1390 [Sulfitobacter donghicola DSW-25 = KCTC 12864 = JCM 14565]|nr:hypothetical protein Z948_1390 [Sulfitobacter donghicola DSW-25 = KCTC 12864 = JCM 14565]
MISAYTVLLSVTFPLSHGKEYAKNTTCVKQRKSRRQRRYNKWSSKMRIALILTSLLMLAACDVPFVPLI